MNTAAPPTLPRRLAYGAALALTLAGLGLALLPGTERLAAPGPQLAGHVAVGCAACHQEMKAQNDPIQPTHTELAWAGRWADCLRCHDYHKNHTSPTPRELPAHRPPDAVLRYLDGGPSPYGDVRHRAQPPSSR